MLSNYSNFNIVKTKLAKLGYSNVEISNRKDKKYKILNPNTNKYVHFGQMGYEDYTKHKDNKRRDAFQSRNNKWKTAPQYSPAHLSYHGLW